MVVTTTDTNKNIIIMDTYILVLWPESQTYMDEPWFDEHAVLADYESVQASQAYFIPIEYINKDLHSLRT